MTRIRFQPTKENPTPYMQIFTYNMTPQVKISCWDGMHEAQHAEVTKCWIPHPGLCKLVHIFLHCSFFCLGKWHSGKVVVTVGANYGTLGCKSPRLGSIFMFSNFYQLESHNVRKSRKRHRQKLDLPWFSYACWKCIFVNSRSSQWNGIDLQSRKLELWTRRLTRCRHKRLIS
jgi:hypothetical protein